MSKLGKNLIQGAKEALAFAKKEKNKANVHKVVISKKENREDYLLAVARLEENNPRIPYEKIRKKLGLND